MEKSTNENPPWDAKNRKPRGGWLKRNFKWLVVAVLMALVAWGMVPKPVEVETTKPSRGSLTVFVSEEGKTRIRNRYVVAAPLAGRMRRVQLKAGDEVKANETLLAVIDSVPTPLLDPRSRAEAEARVASAEATRQRADEAREAAVSAAQLARTTLDRLRNVTVKGSVAASEVDRAEAEHTAREADVRAAEFAQQAAKHDAELARAALESQGKPGGAAVEVKAPVSGRVLKVMQESEMVVTPGTAILEVGDPADIEIEAEILSRDAVAIHPGDEVRIEQWGGEKDLMAKVRRIEPAAFTKISALGVEEQRVIVLCDLTDRPAENLGDRFRVEVRVAVWHKDDVLLVPAGALFREGNEWKALLFEQGKARAVKVQVGRSDGQMTEVLSGITLEDEVIVRPPDAVKDGVKVKHRSAS